MKSITAILAALCVAGMLSACGGGGSGGSPVVRPEPPPDPEIKTCPDGSRIPVNQQCPDPGPPDGRGPLALPGIDQIPLDAVKLTNREMQERFVILERGGSLALQHGKAVRKTACLAYITECTNPEDYSGKVINRNGVAEVSRTDGSTPFSFFQNGDPSFTSDRERTDWHLGEFRKLGSVKIVSHSEIPHPDGIGALVEGGGDSLPFLVVHSAGNKKSDAFPVAAQDPTMPNIQAAIRANKVLYVAGHDRQSGRYVRHSSSSGCKGADEGCIWAPFVAEGVGAGTSLSAPMVASALASVLAVFPDTSHQNLAKFAKACALKGGSGIEALLRQSGGVGVADFTCMGKVTTALANLPTGGRTTTTINGSPVTVSGRTLSLPLAGYTGDIAQYFPKEEEDDFSFGLVPTDGNNFLLVGIQRHGNLFASAGAGLRNDFFGFSEGHGRVFDARLEAGHENAFIRFAQQRSEGGSAISSAQASTLGLTLQKEFQLAGEYTTLHLAAHADKFLGGEAEIPFGSVKLQDGKWEHRVSLSFLQRF